MTPASSVWLKCLLFGLPFGLAQYWGLKAKAHDTQQTKQKDNT